VNLFLISLRECRMIVVESRQKLDSVTEKEESVKKDAFNKYVNPSMKWTMTCFDSMGDLYIRCCTKVWCYPFGNNKRKEKEYI
jgi:hypothetical protein